MLFLLWIRKIIFELLPDVKIPLIYPGLILGMIVAIGVDLFFVVFRGLVMNEFKKFMGVAKLES